MLGVSFEIIQTQYFKLSYPDVVDECSVMYVSVMVENYGAMDQEIITRMVDLYDTQKQLNFFGPITRIMTQAAKLHKTLE